MKRYYLTLILALMVLPLLAQTSSGTIGKYTLTPESGAPVQEIESIKITFLASSISTWGLQNNPDTSAITLESENGTVYKVVKTEFDEDYISCTMYFSTGAMPQTITDSGIYTLKIPEGTFQRNKKPEICNDLITATFTISGPPTNSLSDYVINPADGTTVNNISKFDLTFPEAASTGITLNGNQEEITLSVEDKTFTCVQTIITGNQASLYFGNVNSEEPLTFTRPGDYTLSVPKKIFKASGTDETNNYALQATVYLDNPDFNSMADVILSPAAGSVIPSFSEVTITFPNATNGLEIPGNLNDITLAINGEETPYKAGNYTIKAPYDNVTFRFTETEYGDIMDFTQTGNYTITIPAGTFKESGAGDYANSPITFTFRVKNPDVYNPFDNYTSTPASGETIGEIYDLTLSFPDLEQDQVAWPFDISKVTLQRVGDPTVYTGNSAMLYKGFNIITGFGPQGAQYSEKLKFRTPGEYVVTVPQGTFVSDVDPSISNEEIKLHFIVDAAYNFTYKLTPDPEKVAASLPEILVSPDEVLLSVGIADTDSQALLQCGDTTISLNSESGENGVTLTPSAEVTVGEWTLTIPAGMLKAVNVDNLDIINAKPITAVYTIKEPEQYEYSVTPADNETIPLFTKFTVAVKGNPKAIEINTEAGTPLLKSDGKIYELSATTSSNFAMFAIKGGADLSDGRYTIEIPAGFITTRDSNDLKASLPSITSSFNIEHPTSANYDEGMLLYNEGWFGHDMASFSHVAPDGNISYNAFLTRNPHKSLGVTGTVATRFGNKLYAVCKQSGENLSGIEGGVLTQIDAASMTFVDAITQLQPGEQARSFCGYDGETGYLTTNMGIYPVNLASMTLGERINLAQTIQLECGEIFRYQDYAFVAVKNWDMVAINPMTGSAEEMITGPVATCFVTPNGNLYAATLDSGTPFRKINPVTLESQPVNIKADDPEQRLCVADTWESWTPAPLAVDKNANVIYYATTDGAEKIARLNLDNGEFSADFITLPEGQCLYGQGISVDPITGEIILTAIEKGGGSHYTRNYIYRVDTVNGHIHADKTLTLSKYYWFPSMIVFSGYKAPELDLSDISIADGAVTINLYEHTNLPVGNKYLTTYTLTCAEPNVCSIDHIKANEWVIRPVGKGSTTITVTADFMGLTCSTTFTANTTGVGRVNLPQSKVDVYTTTGLLVLRNADQKAINQLPAGIYIAGGQKIYVR